MLINQSH